MGGDLAPAAPVEGAVLFAREQPDVQVVLVGDEQRILPFLRRTWPVNLSVRHASEVVGMDEQAGASIRKKPDSSLKVCFDLVRTGEAAAVVSAGHSGAVMAGALLVLGRLPRVERPAIAALLPALEGGRCLLLDVGANIQCRPSHLAQFAVLGDAYARRVMGVARPRVAILSNGEEESKGTPLTREAAALLRQGPLHFRGYLEGKDLFSGQAEVIVTDGFTGNLVLKAAEGTALAVAGLLRSAVYKAGLSEKLGAVLLKPTLAGLRRVVDYAEVGGAPLLGIAGVAVVAHGRSNPKAVKNALKAALTTARSGLNDELVRDMALTEEWLPPRRRGKGATGQALSE